MRAGRTSTDDRAAGQTQYERGQQPGKCAVLAASSQQPAAGGIRTPWIVKDDRRRKTVIRRDFKSE